MAIVGKPLISGCAMASAVEKVSPPAGVPENSNAAGTVTARISGGCTIGPNRLRRCTAATAPTAPRK